MSDVNPYDDEVTELFANSDRCRAWAQFESFPQDVRDEFRRLAERLDAIAKAICEKWTESLP